MYAEIDLFMNHQNTTSSQKRCNSPNQDSIDFFCACVKDACLENHSSSIFKEETIYYIQRNIEKEKLSWSLCIS